MSIKLKYKIWLENEAGKPIIGEGRLRILNAVRRTGSISKAAKQLNMSFRRIWAKVRDAELQSGFKIVESSATGTKLTAEGEELLAQFTKLHRSCVRSARTKFKKVFKD